MKTITIQISQDEAAGLTDYLQYRPWKSQVVVETVCTKVFPAGIPSRPLRPSVQKKARRP